jgi:hypothetical protein
MPIRSVMIIILGEKLSVRQFIVASTDCPQKRHVIANTDI